MNLSRFFRVGGWARAGFAALAIQYSFMASALEIKGLLNCLGFLRQFPDRTLVAQSDFEFFFGYGSAAPYLFVTKTLRP